LYITFYSGFYLAGNLCKEPSTSELQVTGETKRKNYNSETFWRKDCHITNDKYGSLNGSPSENKSYLDMTVSSQPGSSMALV
jgi:hypothetical protein